MRVTLRVLSGACALALLGACDDLPPTPVLSVSEARANVLHIAQQGPSQAFCSDEGRRNFRVAVRAYSAALDKAGAPLIIAPTQTDTDQVWALVSMGVFARVLEPSDLPGPMQAFAALLSMPGATISNAREAMTKACPELIEVYRAGARLAHISQRMERAYANHDSRDDIRELAEDRAEQEERVQAAARRLQLKMENSGWDPHAAGRHP